MHNKNHPFLGFTDTGDRRVLRIVPLLSGINLMNNSSVCDRLCLYTLIWFGWALHVNGRPSPTETDLERMKTLLYRFQKGSNFYFKYLMKRNIKIRDFYILFQFLEQKPVLNHERSGMVGTQALYRQVGKKNSLLLWSLRLGRWTATTVQKTTQKQKQK